jgi:hypothetical protein
MKLSFNDSFELNISLLKKILLAQFLFLLLMSIFRVLFYFEFSANEKYILSEIISAYIMGVRLDLVVLGYVQALISILFFIFYFLRSHKIYMLIKKILPIYLLVFYLIISAIIATDFGYFSFFNEHITLMIYGIMDDDTAALWRTMQDNYNIVLIFFIAILYMSILKVLLRNLFFYRYVSKNYKTQN